jgi:hypothetical protein
VRFNPKSKKRCCHKQSKKHTLAPLPLCVFAFNRTRGLTQSRKGATQQSRNQTLTAKNAEVTAKYTRGWAATQGGPADQVKTEKFAGRKILFSSFPRGAGWGNIPAEYRPNHFL